MRTGHTNKAKQKDNFLFSSLFTHNNILTTTKNGTQGGNYNNTKRLDHGESIFINQRPRSDYHVSNLYPNALDKTTDKTFLCSEGSLPVEEACNVLINNNISSAPVYDAQVKEVSETSIVHARSYVGMFDYGDVIAYILLVLQNMPPPGDEGEESDSQARENLTFEIKDIVRRALEGEDVPVKLASGKFLHKF